ncbi:MAG TPA: DUF1993 domain-containing protein [Fontimonas sp.]
MSNPLSMYSLSIPALKRALGNLAQILDKAAAHCASKGIDPAVLVAARLAPDMLPLSKQVQIASDMSKGCAARLSGVEPPAYEDTETTFEQLQQRIARTLEYIGSVDAAAFDGAETRSITIKLRGEPQQFDGLQYLQYFVLPNVYFHCTTAYAILRHNGVQLGKADFLGKP